MTKAELEAKEALEKLSKCLERETEQRNRLRQLQTERDDARSEQQNASTLLTVSVAHSLFKLVSHLWKLVLSVSSYCASVICDCRASSCVTDSASAVWFRAVERIWRSRSMSYVHNLRFLLVFINSNLHCVSKQGATLTTAVTLPILD